MYPYKKSKIAYTPSQIYCLCTLINYFLFPVYHYKLFLFTCINLNSIKVNMQKELIYKHIHAIINLQEYDTKRNNL